MLGNVAPGYAGEIRILQVEKTPDNMTAHSWRGLSSRKTRLGEKKPTYRFSQTNYLFPRDRKMLSWRTSLRKGKTVEEL